MMVVVTLAQIRRDCEKGIETLKSRGFDDYEIEALESFMEYNWDNAYDLGEVLSDIRDAIKHCAIFS